jgi:hypothetical protein
MAINNYKNDVIFLGYKHIKTKYDIYASLMPFINGVLNLVTLTITKPFYNFEIYPSQPKTRFQYILKTTIDILAFTGIIANSSKYGKLYSINMGFVRCFLYVLFTVLIPNLYMINVLDISNIPIIRIIIGVIFIYLLEISVNYLSLIYIDLYEQK